MKPAERVLGLLRLAGAKGATGPEIGKICGLWPGSLFIALMWLEETGIIVSEWELMPRPRHRRYKLAEFRSPKAIVTELPNCTVVTYPGRKVNDN
jgi:hypothetical protein